MIEVIVSHDGKNWIVKNEMFSAEAPTLRGVDKQLGEQVREKCYIKEGEDLKVFMAFENSVIPEWMRQYSQHYFNRIIRVEG